MRSRAVASSKLIAGLAAVAGVALASSFVEIASGSQSFAGYGNKARKPTGAAKIKRDAKKKRNKSR